MALRLALSRYRGRSGVGLCLVKDQGEMILHNLDSVDIDHHRKGDQAEAERNVDFPVHVWIERGRDRRSADDRTRQISAMG